MWKEQLFNRINSLDFRILMTSAQMKTTNNSPLDQVRSSHDLPYNWIVKNKNPKNPYISEQCLCCSKKMCRQWLRSSQIICGIFMCNRLWHNARNSRENAKNVSTVLALFKEMCRQWLRSSQIICWSFFMYNRLWHNARNSWENAKNVSTVLALFKESLFAGYKKGGENIVFNQY